MERQEQETGRRRVKERLIDPLVRLGLGLPPKVTKDTWPGVVDEITLRLAYMDPIGLDAMVEQIISGLPGVPRDRIPASTILITMGHKQQQPPAGASALQRGVLGSSVGKRAIEEGWAPELLKYLIEKHAWVRADQTYAIAGLIDLAGPSLRRKARIEEAEARGEAVSAEDRAFLMDRQKLMNRCVEIAAMSEGAA